jgi:hypothetical protein
MMAGLDRKQKRGFACSPVDSTRRETVVWSVWFWATGVETTSGNTMYGVAKEPSFFADCGDRGDCPDRKSRRVCGVVEGRPS